MVYTLAYSIEKLFQEDKLHRLTLQELYESVKDDFPNKDPYQMRHSIRRSVQSLASRGVLERVNQGTYILVHS